jgi:hypothetical protein
MTLEVTFAFLGAAGGGACWAIIMAEGVAARNVRRSITN